MKTHSLVLAPTVLALMAAACSSSSSTATIPTIPPASSPAPSGASSPSPVSIASAVASPVLSLSPSASPSAGASPSAVPTQPVQGTVQSISGSQIALTNGTSFSLAASGRVVRAENITAADLKTGDYVAITGQRQQNNSVLATIVSVFPRSEVGLAPGQRPMPTGDLMTNATIDQIQGNTFTVTFPSGGANIELAPNAQINGRVDASISDLQPGTSVSAGVANGIANSVTINPSGSPQPGASPAAGT